MLIESFSPYSRELLLPSIVLSVASVLVSLFLVRDVFIGRKTYKFKNDEIIVGRKNKVLYLVNKKDVLTPKIRLDSTTKKPCLFSFVYDKKHHAILINEHNEKAFKAFTSGVSVETCDGGFVDFVLYLLEIFCI
jgi:hypothetical protein